MSEELHKAIGRLEAIAENSEKVSGRLFKKMDEVTANVAALTIAHNSVAGDVDEIGKDITDTILPQIEDYKSKKAKALGYTLGVASVGGAGGFGVKAILVKFGLIT